MTGIQRTDVQRTGMQTDGIRVWWRRLPVTPFGWGVIICGMLTMAVTPFCGWMECLAAGAWLLTTAVCALVMAAARTPITASLQVPHTRISVGECLTVEFTLHNLRPHIIRQVGCMVTVGDAQYPVAVPQLAAGSSTHTTLTVPALRRGPLAVGPVTAPAGDPLGIARRNRQLAAATTVTVYPRLIPLPDNLFAASLRRGVSRAHAALPGDSMEFRSLREYTPQDDARHIHWLSSARLGTPVLTVMNAHAGNAVTLVLDTAAGHYACADEFELAVSCYASLGVHLLRHAYPFTAIMLPLCSPAGTAAPATVAPQLTAFLEACSTVTRCAASADCASAAAPPPAAHQQSQSSFSQSPVSGGIAATSTPGSSAVFAVTGSHSTPDTVYQTLHHLTTGQVSSVAAVMPSDAPVVVQAQQPDTAPQTSAPQSAAAQHNRSPAIQALPHVRLLTITALDQLPELFARTSDPATPLSPLRRQP